MTTSSARARSAPVSQRTVAQSIPPAALALGLGGLLPFLAGAGALWLADPVHAPFAVSALLAYGAVILAFMGGVHWGVAVVRPEAAPGGSPAMLYAASIVPALAAAAAPLLAQWAGLALLVVGFSALLFFDLWRVRDGVMPAWYGRLRVGLTAVVVACLAAALIHL